MKSSPRKHSSGEARFYVLLGGCAALLLLMGGGCAGTSKGPASHRGSTNPIVLENQKQGDPSWMLTDPATQGEIAGYASSTSVNRGQQISFFVSTASPSYTIQIFRMGWYGGAGARSMGPPVTRAGEVQAVPAPDSATGLVDCNWKNPYTITVADDSDPTNWASGIYLTKLVSATGKDAYVVFAVRDDARASDLLFQLSVNTYQAYNDFGGLSLYTEPVRAVKVSFNRPINEGHGAGFFLKFEYNMLRFLEREGYDVTYASDVDVHENSNSPTSHKGLVIVGKSEYWSWQMRQAVTAARDNGAGLGVFAADSVYWQIRYEPSPATGINDRVIVCYKLLAPTNDPDALNPSTRYLTTTLWRDAPVSLAENALLGVMYDLSAGIGAGDMIVANADDWVLAGSGLQNADHLTQLLGSEVDRVYPGSPPGTQVLMHSPYTNPQNGASSFSDMTEYISAAGNAVVATGTERWSWGVDDFNQGGEDITIPYHPVLTNPAVQQVTRNIFGRFGASPASL